MLVLFKKENFLYVKCLLNLKKPIKHQNRTFRPGNVTLLLLPEEVNALLTRNGNVKLWNGKKFIKVNLGEFNDILTNKKYKVEDVVEQQKPMNKKVEIKPKQQVVKQEPKKEEPKVEEEKVIEIPVIVEPEKILKDEKVVAKEEVKVEVEEDKKPNENKKQRHKQNNQQQGGDK